MATIQLIFLFCSSILNKYCRVLISICMNKFGVFLMMLCLLFSEQSFDATSIFAQPSSTVDTTHCHQAKVLAHNNHDSHQVSSEHMVMSSTHDCCNDQSQCIDCASFCSTTSCSQFRLVLAQILFSPTQSIQYIPALLNISMDTRISSGYYSAIFKPPIYS